MENTDLESQIEGARAYDSLFVPALFGQWASVLSQKLDLSSKLSVLDVACGTGILAREIFQSLEKSGRVVGLDPNLGMLAVAEEHESRIEWKQGVAESLPFDSNVFDMVLCQFGLMFFQDSQAAIKEFLRVLKPNGVLTLAVWDSIDNIPGYQTEYEIIKNIAGEDAAHAVAVPFNMGNKTNLQDLLVKAGATNVKVETHRGVARFPDISTMVNAELRGWLPIMGIQLAESVIQEILIEAESEMSKYTSIGKTVEFEITAHIATATN